MGVSSPWIMLEKMYPIGSNPHPALVSLVVEPLLPGPGMVLHFPLAKTPP